MNTPIRPIDVDKTDLSDYLKDIIKKELAEDELVYFAAEQKGDRPFLLQKYRKCMYRAGIAFVPRVAFFAALPGLGLSLLSWWWLLLCIPSVLLYGLYLFIDIGYKMRMLDSYNGLFVITNKVAKFISSHECWAHDSSEFKIGRNMVTQFQVNPDGTAMVNFDRKYLLKAKELHETWAWQFVPNAAEVKHILDKLSQ